MVNTDIKPPYISLVDADCYSFRNTGYIKYRFINTVYAMTSCYVILK